MFILVLLIVAMYGHEMMETVVGMGAETDLGCNNNGLENTQASRGARSYIVMPSLMSASQGVQICNESGARLVSIENEAKDLDMILEIRKLYRRRAGVWTSGRRNQTGENFVWTTTGQPITTYNHWANGREKNKIGCIFYKEHVTEGLSWFVDDCSERKVVICEEL